MRKLLKEVNGGCTKEVSWIRVVVDENIKELTMQVSDVSIVMRVTHNASL